VELTTGEIEYFVSAVTDVFTEHVILQYNVTSTLPDTVMDYVAFVAEGASNINFEEDYCAKPLSDTNRVEQSVAPLLQEKATTHSHKASRCRMTFEGEGEGGTTELTA
jgi:hypothetical protein